MDYNLYWEDLISIGKGKLFRNLDIFDDGVANILLLKNDETITKIFDLINGFDKIYDYLTKLFEDESLFKYMSLSKLKDLLKRMNMNNLSKKGYKLLGYNASIFIKTFIYSNKNKDINIQIPGDEPRKISVKKRLLYNFLNKINHIFINFINSKRQIRRSKYMVIKEDDKFTYLQIINFIFKKISQKDIYIAGEKINRKDVDNINRKNNQKEIRIIKDIYIRDEITRKVSMALDYLVFNVSDDIFNDKSNDVCELLIFMLKNQILTPELIFSHESFKSDLINDSNKKQRIKLIKQKLLDESIIISI
jgi:hypothetical protein